MQHCPEPTTFGHHLPLLQAWKKGTDVNNNSNHVLVEMTI